MIIGSILGAVAGYFGRGVDEVIMRISDLVFAFPTIILAMIVAASLGPSLTNAVIALLVVSWPSYARVMRSMVLGERAREYVIAGRLLGASAYRSLGRDVLPNVAAPVLVLATLDFGNADPAALRPVLPRPRGDPADAGMGIDGRRRRAELQRMVAVRLPRSRDLHRRDGLQLPRRRHARRARPAVGRQGPGGVRMTGLTISDLKLELGDPKSPKQILRGIDLEVPSGQITGLAGESGSGKTVTGLTVCGLQPAGSRVERARSGWMVRAPRSTTSSRCPRHGSTASAVANWP